MSDSNVNITVYGFTDGNNAAHGKYSDSGTFVFKLEYFLRMVELKYTKKHSNPRAAPRGKLPFVEIDGQIVADSQEIIETLCKKLNIDLDKRAGLTSLEIAQNYALQAMLEQSTYFVVLTAAFRDDTGYESTYAELQKGLGMATFAIAPLARRGVISNLHGQGYGRLSLEEVYQRGCSDVRCLAEVLGNKNFFGGNEPVVLDCVAAAVLTQIVGGHSYSTRDEVLKHANLVQYVTRMNSKYFPAIAGWTQQLTSNANTKEE